MESSQRSSPQTAAAAVQTRMHQSEDTCDSTMRLIKKALAHHQAEHQMCISLCLVVGWVDVQ